MAQCAALIEGAMRPKNAYTAIIESIFLARFRPGAHSFEFRREEIVEHAGRLGIRLPKNLGDVVYSFRYRAELPDSILGKAAEGHTWIIRPAGTAKYCFVEIVDRPLTPNPSLSVTKVPDATPGVIAKYALSDEQALLAKLRYNRLVDIFAGLTCYSLQNHLRTNVPGMGQVETDEIYIGIDKKGAHYIIPVQAKGKRDRLSIVQIEQDMGLCEHRFRSLICRPIGAWFLPDQVIALLEFERDDAGISVCSEKHYVLVPPDDVSDADLEAYKARLTT